MKHYDELKKALEQAQAAGEVLHKLGLDSYAAERDTEVYLQHGVSLFNCLSDIVLGAARIEFGCRVIANSLNLLDNLYANMPIVSDKDAKESEKIAEEKKAEVEMF